MVPAPPVAFRSCDKPFSAGDYCLKRADISVLTRGFDQVRVTDTLLARFERSVQCEANCRSNQLGNDEAG
jgi:hypothetical protein